MNGDNRVGKPVRASARAAIVVVLLAAAIVAVSASLALAHAESPQAGSSAADQTLQEESPAQQIASDEEARTLLERAGDQGSLAFAGVSKEETVHASLQPDGSFTEMSSRVVLKNTEGLDVVVDETALDSVTLADEEQVFAQSGETLAIQAQGEDVSYSGTPSASLPVGVTVEYRLDGKEISPAALVGKSGEVSITYRFTNAASTPFAAVGILELDDERFSDVSADNGKVMPGTDAATVVGMCFPGLQSQIDVESIDLPSSFTLTAQVSDFRLDSATVLITPSLFEELDSIDFEAGNVSEMSDAFDGLHDALDELAAGAGNLSTGAEGLQQGLAELKSGIEQVGFESSTSPDDAADALEGLATQQSAALDDLTTTLNEVELTEEQRAEVAASLEQLDGTSASLTDAATALRAQDPSAAAQQLVALKQGINEAADAASQLSAGASRLKAGIAAFDEEGIDALEAGVSDVVSQFDEAAESLDDVAARARAYQTFSGKPDGMEGSVLFVYQIDAVH